MARREESMGWGTIVWICAKKLAIQRLLVLRKVVDVVHRWESPAAVWSHAKFMWELYGWKPAPKY